MPTRIDVVSIQHRKLFSSLARLQAFNVNVNHRAYVKQHFVRHAKVYAWKCYSTYTYNVECSEHMTRANEGNSLNKVVKQTIFPQHVSWRRFLKTQSWTRFLETQPATKKAKKAPQTERHHKNDAKTSVKKTALHQHQSRWHDFSMATQGKAAPATVHQTVVRLHVKTNVQRNIKSTIYKASYLSYRFIQKISQQRHRQT